MSWCPPDGSGETRGEDEQTTHPPYTIHMRLCHEHIPIDTSLLGDSQRQWLLLGWRRGRRSLRQPAIVRTRRRIFVYVDKWPEEKYPARFAAVLTEFAQKQADLDSQIADLSVKTAACIICII